MIYYKLRPGLIWLRAWGVGFRVFWVYITVPRFMDITRYAHLPFGGSLIIRVEQAHGVGPCQTCCDKAIVDSAGCDKG